MRPRPGTAAHPAARLTLPAKGACYPVCDADSGNSPSTLIAMDPCLQVCYRRRPLCSHALVRSDLEAAITCSVVSTLCQLNHYFLPGSLWRLRKYQLPGHRRPTAAWQLLFCADWGYCHAFGCVSMMLQAMKQLGSMASSHQCM